MRLVLLFLPALAVHLLAGAAARASEPSTVVRVHPRHERVGQGRVPSRQPRVVVIERTRTHAAHGRLRPDPLAPGLTARPRPESAYVDPETVPGGGSDPFVRKQQTYVYHTPEGWVWIGEPPRTPAEEPNYVSKAWAGYKDWAFH